MFSEKNTKIFKFFDVRNISVTQKRSQSSSFVLWCGNKDKSEPHHRVTRFGFLLSPPDDWGRQLAAGADEGT